MRKSQGTKEQTRCISTLSTLHQGPTEAKTSNAKPSICNNAIWPCALKSTSTPSMQHASPGESHLFGYAGLSQVLNVSLKSIQEVLSHTDNDCDGITVARPPRIAKQQGALKRQTQSNTAKNGILNKKLNVPVKKVFMTSATDGG